MRTLQFVKLASCTAHCTLCRLAPLSAASGEDSSQHERPQLRKFRVASRQFCWVNCVLNMGGTAKYTFVLCRMMVFFYYPFVCLTVTVVCNLGRLLDMVSRTCGLVTPSTAVMAYPQPMIQHPFSDETWCLPYSRAVAGTTTGGLYGSNDRAVAKASPPPVRTLETPVAMVAFRMVRRPQPPNGTGQAVR